MLGKMFRLGLKGCVGRVICKGGMCSKGEKWVYVVCKGRGKGLWS